MGAMARMIMELLRAISLEAGAIDIFINTVASPIIFAQNL